MSLLRRSRLPLPALHIDRLTARRAAAAVLLPWHRPALAAVLAVSAFLNLYRLTQFGYANLYYAATVKSMLTSWHSFFFVSFDPAGFVTVDKPPLGFWIQAAFARLLGFHDGSVLLPQALAGVASVAMLYLLVRRAWGPTAGLLAALALALTPVAVAVNRNNTIDSLLVLTLLLAIWAVLRAAETGRLRLLLLGMALVGLGFNIKMLQAFLVVPALVVVYLFGAPSRWWSRLWHLAVSGVLLLVVSFAWVAAVDLTPAGDRPYVGSSVNNTALELTFGHNGLRRLFGGNRGRPAGPPPGPNQPQGQPQPNGPPGGANGPTGEIGTKGPLRLVNEQLGGQASWLLAAAILGGLFALYQTGLRRRRDQRWQSLVLWGAWLAPAAGFFSIAGLFHRYYLVMIAPPLAALAGIGLVSLWQAARGGRWRSWQTWALPVVLAASAALQWHLLRPFPDWRGRLLLPVVALSVLATAAARIGRPSWLGRRRMWLAGGALTLAAAAMMLAPAVWSYQTIDGIGGPLPSGGPVVGRRGGPRPGAPRVGQQPGGAPAPQPAGPGGGVSPALLAFLRANRGDTTFLVATQSAQQASPLMLATGEAVMAMGGFSGGDPILTADRFAAAVRENQIRYVLLSGGPGAPIGPAGPPNGPPQQAVGQPPGPNGPPPGGAAGPSPNRPQGGNSGPPAGGVGNAPGPAPPGNRPAAGAQPYGQPGVSGQLAGPGGQNEVTRWITQHCRRVPPPLLGNSPQLLFDCRGTGG